MDEKSYIIAIQNRDQIETTFMKKSLLETHG